MVLVDVDMFSAVFVFYIFIIIQVLVTIFDFLLTNTIFTCYLGGLFLIELICCGTVTIIHNFYLFKRCYYRVYD